MGLPKSIVFGDTVTLRNLDGWRVVKVRLKKGLAWVEPPDGTGFKQEWVPLDKLRVTRRAADPDEPLAAPPEDAKSAATTEGKEAGGITRANLKQQPWYRLRDQFLYASGGWFMASRLLSLIVSDRDARMLDFLINWQKTYGKSKEWFFCLTSDITKHAFIPPTTQPAIFKSLRDQRLIQTEMRGRSAKRWIKIDYHRIVRRIDKKYGAFVQKYLDGECPDNPWWWRQRTQREC